MVNTYILVNPHIEGTLETKVKARNSKEAAEMIYKNISEHFNNSVNKFHFTIQKGSSGQGSLSHFEVKENRNDKEVEFHIKPYNIKNQSESESRFFDNLNKFKSKLNQDGGKHKKKKKSKDSSDSDSSDLSDSYDYYRRARSYPVSQPISYWWYDPYLYNLNNVYIPTFYSYLTPYIELVLP